MALIILEGPDGSGKTTAAEKLATELGHNTAVVLHKGPPKRLPLHEYEDLDFYEPALSR